MAVKPIVIYGDPVLKAMCMALDFKEHSEIIQSACQDMVDTLAHVGGQGLAAPQIGIPVRIIVLHPEFFPGRPKDSVMVNPTIRRPGSLRDVKEEGCLSIPGVREYITRPTWCEVSFFDNNGQGRVVAASSALARCIQHEVDHLNGTLILDYVSRGRQKQAAKRMKQLSKRAA
jgi:peptide deformylase